MVGIDCIACKGAIGDDEPMVTFSPKRGDALGYLHHCCFVDTLLFETFGALVLGAVYESNCTHEHERNANEFSIQVVSRQLSKATSKVLVRNKKGIDPDTVKFLRGAGYR